MSSLLRSLLATSMLTGFAGASPETTVQGVLIDKECSSKAETRIVPGPRLEGGMTFAYTHTRQCALLPACQRSGYGVFTYDNKFLEFDSEGNRKALAALKASKKEDDLRVEVTGEVQGDAIKVVSLKLE